MTYKEIQEEAMYLYPKNGLEGAAFVFGVLWCIKQEHPKDFKDIFEKMGVPMTTTD